MMAAIRFAPAVAGFILLIACAHEEDKGALRDRSLVPEPKEKLPTTLDRGLLSSYVKALTELRREGLADDADIGDDLKRPAMMAQRMLFDPAALKVMRAHGFEHAKLRLVRSWVLLAYGAVRFDARRGALEAERERDLKAMETLKAKMSPEDFEEMRTQIEESVRSIAALYREVPADHRRLVAKQIEVLEALLK